MWLRGMKPNGYGFLHRKGYSSTSAHRVIYQMYNGALAKGQTLDHLCRNRACVRPDHMEVVTQAENCRRGLRTKFSSEVISDIRDSRLKGVPYKVLMERYGISKPQIYQIAKGKQRLKA